AAFPDPHPTRRALLPVSPATPARGLRPAAVDPAVTSAGCLDAFSYIISGDREAGNRIRELQPTRTKRSDRHETLSAC
ncbi:Hypothetical predicted protein, partial [Pelobates cultripes]